MVRILSFMDPHGETKALREIQALAESRKPNLVVCVGVIDGATVLTGSFNFTRAAEEHNAENLLVIQDGALADKYAANWKVHAGHSEFYEGR